MLSLPVSRTLYAGFLVMIACCVPLINVSLSTMQYDTTGQRAVVCGPKAPDESGYAGVVTSLNGQTAAAPLWWVLIHKLSKGVTQAAVATIPAALTCARSALKCSIRVSTAKRWRRSLQDFTNDCYSVALYLWKQRDQGPDKGQNHAA
jgi:hypothetical protein